MAQNSEKSKDTNTFRFKSFAERVGEIDIRRLALYHIGHSNEELPENNETYFHQTLKKWMVLNLTEEFNAFSRQCLKIVTLPQLIHRKDFVMDLLLERLSTATNLAIQPLLELLYVLARDLREEFYTFFHRVLDRLIGLLRTQDPEQLEWTLVCLAYLFKTLKPYLKKNIGIVFHTILPLLDEQCYDEHVTNFAVECFSFIARDVRDYSKFVNFMLDTVAREHVESVQGCGRLFFEIVRGVKGQFHSVAPEFLYFIFERLIDGQLPSAAHTHLLSDIVHSAVRELLHFIHPTNVGVFWTQLCAVAQTATVKSGAPISQLLDVFLLAADYHDGRYLAELDVLVTTVLQMLDSAMHAEQLGALKSLAQLVAKMLLCGSTQLTQLDTSRLLKKMLTIRERSIYDDFVLSLAAHAQFDILVLPAVVAYFERHLDAGALKLLAQIVLQKAPLAINASGLQAWRIYSLPTRQAATRTRVQAALQQLNFDNEQCVTEQVLWLLLAPHLSAALDCDALAAVLKRETCAALQRLQQTGSTTQQLEQNIALVALLLETQLHLDCAIEVELAWQLAEALLPHSHDLRALGALDQLLLAQPNVRLGDQAVAIASHLSPLLSSHVREVRMTAAHCLQALHASTPRNPYEIFNTVDRIEPDVHTYREQLVQLQKLDGAGALFPSFDTAYKVDTLRFLLGQLYHNFKFIWEPVLKLVEGCATVMDASDFWSVYHAQLLSTAAAVVNYDTEEVMVQKAAAVPGVELWADGLLPRLSVSPLGLQQLLNYRNLLWLRLPHYGHLAELKNRELVTIFLRFVDEEYRCKLEQREHTWNLSAQSTDGEDAAAELEQQQQLDKNNEMEKPTTERKRARKDNQQGQVTRGILQTLQHKLAVFAAQPNPKALYREPEMYAFYMELLASANPLLQRAALDCVLAYKAKSLLIYRDQLYALCDERKFRDELVNFKLDAVTVPTEAREALMPVLLRLLYGKMLTKGTQRNVSAQVRKGLILRFLGQCSGAEIFSFLRMAFARYALYAEDDRVELFQISALVRVHFRLEAVWSARRLHSVVNLLEIVRKEFGGLLDSSVQLYMLKLLVFVGSVCNTVLQLDGGARLHAKMPVVYRNLRSATLTTIVHFYAHIEQFEWTASQFSCIADVFVWPSIERLAADSIHTPTPLLRLLLQWGERPPHFAQLLMRPPVVTEDLPPPIFHHIIALLLNEKARPAVRRPIMMLVERLLQAAASADSDCAAVALQLVQPCIQQILKRLRVNFGYRKTRQHIDKLDLSVLALLTTHVQDAATCDSLLELLLPVLIVKSQTEAGAEAVCQVIVTLSNLIRRLDAPEPYLLKVAPLFEHITEVAARKLLCQLVTDIVKRRCHQLSGTGDDNDDDQVATRLRNMARLVCWLNAWDRRWVEQPDYERRLAALHELRDQLLPSGGVDMQLGVLVIYNCFYYLRHDRDIGLRDNASELLQQMLPTLVRRYADDQRQLDYLVGDVFISLARRLIGRDAVSPGGAGNESARAEVIRLLGVMARECKDAHEVLSDLAPLGSSDDAEVDFFENLVHLQAHRHGRALLKFCAHAATLRRPPAVRTLTHFVLPLATRYLLQERYAAKHTLVDAAIEAVGVACRLLPWQHYHTVLRHYLQKMRSTHAYQKQCVRIVVRILDAFHFDLSQAYVNADAWQRLQQELKIHASAAEEPEELKQSEMAKAGAGAETAEADGEDDEESPEEHKAERSLAAELAEQQTKDYADDDDEKEEEEEQQQPNAKGEPAVHRSLLLTPSASKRVLATITTLLIPALNRCITEKSSYDNKHKVNRKRFSVEREEEEILRVPIALAIVKLMQKLPKELLESGLCGVFMKVCTFLRSPLKSVRMLTRDILRKIMLTIGAGYLALLMDHLQHLLTRGFQVHVLAVTVHGVLDGLRDQMQPADIESCLGNLLDVALNDIFGDATSAQKHIDKITAHTPEAKPSTKSYLVLYIAARHVRETCLLDLLLPFREHLARSHSRKLTLKIQDCFSKMVAGLAENAFIPRESLLMFIYGIVSESITDLLLPGSERQTLTVHERERMRRARPDDCLLIPQAPRMRSGAVHSNVKSNAQANAHILVEFGLQLLHILLKRKKLHASAAVTAIDYDYEAFLNPLLPLLRDALQSTHVRVTTFAMRCLASIWNEEYALSALQQYLPAIVHRIFEILKNFTNFGGVAKHEDNLQLVKATFKAIVALLRKCNDDYYTLTAEQTDQLVLQVEQDLNDEGDGGGAGSQATSFTLLKAVLARRIDTDALHGAMKRVGDLAVTARSDYVRDEARSMLTTYLMEYTLKRRVDQIIKFFTVQLGYAVTAGRQSVIQFLQTIVRKFPQPMLAKRAELLYLSLGPRLVNDEEPQCRRAVAECLELLIGRVDKAQRQQLFDLTLVFFEAAETRPALREMAAVLCSRFVSVERQAFGARLPQLLPLLVGRLAMSNPLAPGRFVRAPILLGVVGTDASPQLTKKFKLSRTDAALEHLLPDEDAAAAKAEQQQRAADHEIIQLQYCLLKVFEHCSEELFARGTGFAQTLDEVAYQSQKLLAHEHAWVRCNAAKTLAHITASCDFALVGRKICSAGGAEEAPSTGLDFIYLNPAYDIKSLVLDLCAQMIPGETAQDMIDEIIKIFLHIAQMLRHVPFSCVRRELDDDNGEVETRPKINMHWLVHNVRYLVNKEVAQAPHAINIRSGLFTLVEGLIALLSVEELHRLTPMLLAMLVREMSEEDQNVEAELRQLALRVGSRLRKRIGSDVYDKLRAQAQTKLMVRRAERKKVLAQEKVHDPVRAAKRKVAMQERKKAAKKLKTNVIRGKAADVKQKLRRRKRKADDDFF